MFKDDDTDVTSRGNARELLYLPLRQVVPAAANPRVTIEKESFQELKKSICSNGLLQPIAVRPLGDRYEIIGGHRRFAVFLELAAENPGNRQYTHIAATIVDANDTQAPVLRLAENINRSDLTPLEQVEGLARAVAAGNKKEALAASLGWPMRKLYKYLQLAEAPVWLREFAREVVVPKQHRDDTGAPVLNPITNAPTYEYVKRPGLAPTDVFELMTFYNVLHDEDVANIKANGGDKFKARAEQTTRKLAMAAAANEWSTETLRTNIAEARAPHAAARSKRKPAKPAFTVTEESAFIDFKRVASLVAAERDKLATALTKQLGIIGFTVVITD